MLGQATSILTSTVGSGIVTAHKRTLQADIASHTVNSGAAGAQDISADAYIASVTMVLNGVNSFLYQLVLLPLYTLIAFQKTIVCTVNDAFCVFDVSGFVVRVGRADLQKASDVTSGVCLSAFFEEGINSIGETETSGRVSQAASDLMRDAGQSASSFMISGDRHTHAHQTQRCICNQMA